MRRTMRTFGGCSALVLLLAACTGDTSDGGNGTASAESACVDEGEPFEGATILYI